jgi:hypothetical protein
VASLVTRLYQDPCGEQALWAQKYTGCIFLLLLLLLLLMM